jgi:hypothetical protein
VQQRLDLLTHTLYAQQQQIITILFRQEFGERVKMRQVWIPARDKTLVPSWVFTPGKWTPASAIRPSSWSTAASTSTSTSASSRRWTWRSRRATS